MLELQQAKLPVDVIFWLAQIYIIHKVYYTTNSTYMYSCFSGATLK